MAYAALEIELGPEADELVVDDDWLHSLAGKKAVETILALMSAEEAV